MRSDIVSGLQTEIVVIGVVTKCDDYLLMNWMLLSCNHVWNQLERYHDRCTCRSFHSFSVLSDFKLKLKCRNALKLQQFTQTTTIQLLRDKIYDVRFGLAEVCWKNLKTVSAFHKVVYN